MKKEVLITFQDRLDLGAKFEAAEQNTGLLNSLAIEMSNDIKKARVVLLKDAIAKENALKGQYYKAMDVKPDPARYSVDKDTGEKTLVQAETFSTVQLEAQEKALKSYNALTDALIKCTTMSFIAPEGTAEEIAAAKEAYVKADTKRWALLKQLAGKKEQKQGNKTQNPQK